MTENSGATIVLQLTAAAMGEPATRNALETLLRAAGADGVRYHPAERALAATDVLDAVAHGFGVTTADLCGRTRTQTVCEARQGYALLARQLTDLSLGEMATACGGRSPSGMLYNLGVAEMRVRHAHDFRRKCQSAAALLSRELAA